MDKITIRSSVALDLSRLGKPYTISPCYTDKTFNYKFRLYLNENYGEKDSYLTIIANDSKEGIIISGSLRKWYFGNVNAVLDFNYRTFLDCISILSKKLEVSENELWESEVTYLEIGGNVKLKRKFDCIIPSMTSYPRLGKAQVKNETVYFKGGNYELIAYDKIKEIFKKRNSNKSVRNKIVKGVFVLRFEIKLRYPSGTPLKEQVKTLNHIKANWSYLIDYWQKTYLKIQVIQIQSPTLVLKKQFASRRELKDYFCVMFINQNGIDAAYQIINSSVRDKKEERDHFVSLLGKFEATTLADYHEVVKEAVVRKAEIMKRYCNEI